MNENADPPEKDESADGARLFTQDQWDKLAPSPAFVNAEPIPLEAADCFLLKEANALKSDITSLELIPAAIPSACPGKLTYPRRHAVDCVVRWRRHSKEIVPAFVAVLQKIPAVDTRKRGADTLSRCARNESPDYPSSNSFAAFDVRAFALACPEYRPLLELNDERHPEKPLCKFLFEAGWKPSPCAPLLKQETLCAIEQ